MRDDTLDQSRIARESGQHDNIHRSGRTTTGRLSHAQGTRVFGGKAEPARQKKPVLSVPKKPNFSTTSKYFTIQYFKVHHIMCIVQVVPGIQVVRRSAINEAVSWIPVSVSRRFISKNLGHTGIAEKCAQVFGDTGTCISFVLLAACVESRRLCPSRPHQVSTQKFNALNISQYPLLHVTEIRPSPFSSKRRKGSDNECPCYLRAR